MAGPNVCRVIPLLQDFFEFCFDVVQIRGMREDDVNLKSMDQALADLH
jgi:hypothetical protein